MSKFVRLFSLFLMLWIFHGPKPALAETWYELKSKNFIIYSNAKDAQIKKIAEDLEYFRFFLQNLTQVDDTKTTLPLVVFAYKNSRRFRSELKIADNIGGFYMHNFHGTFAYGDFSKTVLGAMTGREILFHEYVHFFIRHFSNIKYPRWYDEGFADYLSTFSFNDGMVNVGNVIYNRVFSLKVSGWVPLEKVLATNKWNDVAKKYDKSQALIYAQAWFLVHYLNADPGRKQKMLDYIQAIDNGSAYDVAFADIFQMTFEELDQELKAYWQNGQIPYSIYDFTDVDFKPKIKIKELSDYEGKLVKLRAISYRVPYAIKLSKFKKKANKIIKKFPDSIEAKILLAEKLLFQDDKEIEQLGEDIIRTVLAEEPNNSQANAIMGIIQFNKLNDTENQDEKDKYAFLGRKYLRKAVALDPLNVFAQYYLGFFYVFNASDNPNPGINALAAAVDLMPQHNSIKFHYALINARYGNLEEAMFFLNNSKKSGISDKWNRVVDFCLSEIQTNGADHKCIFANLEQFDED